MKQSPPVLAASNQICHALATNVQLNGRPSTRLTMASIHMLALSQGTRLQLTLHPTPTVPLFCTLRRKSRPSFWATTSHRHVRSYHPLTHLTTLIGLICWNWYETPPLSSIASWVHQRPISASKNKIRLRHHWTSRQKLFHIYQKNLPRYMLPKLDWIIRVRAA